MSLIDNILTELERIRDERGTHANTATRVGTALIDLLSLIRDIGNSKLSKTDDDTASGEIGFQKGLWVKTANGASKVIELLTSGLAKVKSLLVNGTWGIDDDGDATLHDVAANDVTARDAAIRDVTGRDAEFENLRVTKEAHFFRLVVDELLSNKGAIIISSANCVVEATQEDQSTYTVYFSKTGKDGIRVNNPWVVGDHALCLTFKGEGAGTFSDVKNRYYWRKVVYVNSDITYEGKTYHSISLSKTIGEGSTEPAAGDNIVQLGYSGQTPIPARQTAIILSAYQTMDAGVTPPSLAFYKGINDFALSSHRYTYMDGVANEFFGDFKVLVNNSYTSMTTLLATTNSLIAEIRNDLGTVGVDINGDDMAINLKAGKVNFLMPDGSTNAKISIDPTTGTLHAVDGEFEGTVKANNLYRALAIASKRENALVFTPEGESRMWVFVKGSDNYIHPDTGKEYTVGEYYEISIAEFFSLYAYAEFSSYFSVCIGPADEVVITSISGLPYTENSFSVNLPRSQDFNGKVVTISNIIENSTVRVYQCDGGVTAFSTTGISLVRDDNDETIEIGEPALMQSYLDIAAGEVATFYSVGAYWIRLRVIDSGINGSAVTQQWVMDYVTQNAVTIATLAGYATQQWVNDQHFLTSFTETDPTVPSWAKQSSKPSYQFSEITNTPTTIAGYGITDAYISNGTIYIGGNSITPLTQHQSLSNYVQKSQTAGLLKNDGTVDTNTYLTSVPSNYVSVDNDGIFSHQIITDNQLFVYGGNGHLYGSIVIGDNNGGVVDMISTNSLGQLTWGSDSVVMSSDISDMATETWVGQQFFSHGHAISGGLTSGYARVEDGEFSQFSMPFTFDPSDGGTVIPAFAALASHNNLTASGNEFTCAASGQSGSYYINYRTAGGSNGSITEYHFCDGAGNTLASISNGQFSGNAASATKALKVVQGNNDRLVTNANGVTVVGDNNNSTIGFRTDGSAHYEPYIMTRKTLDGNNSAEFHLDYYTANGSHHFKDATSGYADVYAKSFVIYDASYPTASVSMSANFASGYVYFTSGMRGYIFDAPVTQSSDIRMKDVTDYLEPSVYDMASAPLVRFRWKNDAAGAEHVGTVAQFWQQVVPEAVVETADGMLAMDYGVAGVMAGVTAARKAVELERRIEEQDRRIEELEQIINQLKGN